MMWSNIILGVILACLLWLLELFLKKQEVSTSLKVGIAFIFLIISLLSYSTLSGIIFSIIKLRYLSIKLYLFILVIVNAIILYTLNKKISWVQKILNYILFIMMMIMFGSVISIVLGNKIEAFYVMDIGNAIILMNLSIIVFSIYLLIQGFIYIESCYQKGIVLFHLRDIKKIPLGKFKKIVFSWKKKKKQIPKEKTDSITIEDLYNMRKDSILLIHGVDCSIIFNDSRQDHILENYKRLSKDIHSKLVNGYTLEENLMFRDICYKLKISNLKSIDLENTNLLNKISIEEYKLLRRVLM